jgi:exosortase K
MNRRIRMIQVSQVIAVLLCGAAIKLYYSTASVNDLLWILAPTRVLVTLVTGVGFTFESYSGYMSSDHSFIIAGACSGVNFLITAFLMLSIAKLWRHRDENVPWRFIFISLGAAYLTTIVANAFRISSALFIRRADPELIWLNPEELHRFEGIVIYFGFLLLLFIVSERMASGAQPQRTGVWVRVRRYALPLAVYYATTLGIPLVNGAFRRGPAAAEFWQHMFFVLLTPLFLLLTLALMSFLKRSAAGQTWRQRIKVQTAAENEEDARPITLAGSIGLRFPGYFQRKKIAAVRVHGPSDLCTDQAGPRSDV